MDVDCSPEGLCELQRLVDDAFSLFVVADFGVALLYGETATNVEISWYVQSEGSLCAGGDRRILKSTHSV